MIQISDEVNENNANEIQCEEVDDCSHATPLNSQIHKEPTANGASTKAA